MLAGLFCRSQTSLFLILCNFYLATYTDKYRIDIGQIKFFHLKVNNLAYTYLKMLYKSFQSNIEDISEKGVVTMYVNSFGNKDSDGDISAKGAFTKTLNEGINRIKHFLNHDTRLLLGLPKELTQDEFGLKAVSQMNMSKQIGKDTYQDYKMHAEMGRSMEHSIGFNVIKRDEKDQSIIKEYKLWEYSTLTSWGANENTPMVDLKSKEDIVDQIEFLEQILRKGDYTDQKFKLIEKQLNKLQKAFTDIQPQSSTVKPDAIKIFRQTLIT